MSEGGDEPTDEAVVRAAAEAAEGVVFSRIDRADVDDLDVTVSFEDGILEVDVYLHAPDALADEQQVAEDAALSARTAVDELLE
jgi:ribosomal protein S3